MDQIDGWCAQFGDLDLCDDDWRCLILNNTKKKNLNWLRYNSKLQFAAFNCLYRSWRLYRNEIAPLSDRSAQISNPLKKKIIIESNDDAMDVHVI